MLPRLECNGATRLTATSTSWVQAILLPQPPEQLGLQVPPHPHPPPNAWLGLVFLVETGFHHVGQADLKLLTSSDLSTSASQSDYRHEPLHPAIFFVFDNGILTGVKQYLIVVLICINLMISDVEYFTKPPSVTQAGVQWRDLSSP